MGTTLRAGLVHAVLGAALATACRGQGDDARSPVRTVDTTNPDAEIVRDGGPSGSDAASLDLPDASHADASSAGDAKGDASTGPGAVLFGGRGNTGLLDDTWRWSGTTWSSVPGAGPSARFAHSLG